MRKPVGGGEVDGHREVQLKPLAQEVEEVRLLRPLDRSEAHLA